MLSQSKLTFQSTSTTPSTSTSTSTSTTSSSQQPQQILLILCGVVGTGKSTLATALEKLNFVRICQDDLGSRGVCETKCRKALSEGKSVIIDRQNFDKSQRKIWIELGKQFPSVSIRGFVMGTTEEECISRLNKRVGHPTVSTSKQALSLLDKFIELWQEPDINEGFDRLIVLPALPPSEGLTIDLLTTLLQVLEDSPPPTKKKQVRRY